MKSYVYDVVYETIGTSHKEGVMACGFLPKEPEVRGHNFLYYGGFLILSGSGSYIDEFGHETPIGVGDFVQRRPGVKHTTTVDEGEPWVEFYVCFGRKLYETLVAIDAISDDPIIPTVLTEDTFKRCEDLLFRFKRGGIMNRKTLLLDLQKFVMRMNTLSQEMESTDSNEVIISELCLVLGERLNVKIDIKALCQQYPLGYESIRKIFKARVGTSLHHYRVMKRINEAKKVVA